MILAHAVILVDSNVFMYAAGAAHPNKEPSARLLQRIAEGTVEASTDAEVLQEILHRYRAIRRWQDGQRVYDLARRIVPTVLPVTVEVLDEACRILDAAPRVMARDAVHAAVVRLAGLEAICSFDGDFDAIDGVVRKQPQDVA